jgi:hypothetical protein
MDGMATHALSRDKIIAMDHDGGGCTKAPIGVRKAGHGLGEPKKP